MTLLLYILRQLTVSTVFAVGALGFVVFPGIAVSAVHRLGGVSLQAVLRYIPLVGVELAPYLVSLGFLLAIVTTFGRLAADKEWIAIGMCGIHPLRTMIPGVILALVLGVGTHALLASVSPVWKLEQGNFRSNALLEGFRNLAPGRTELDLGPFYLGAVRRDGAAFVDGQILAPGKEGEDDIRAVFDRAELTFTDDHMLVQFTTLNTVNDDDMLRSASPSIVIELSSLVKPRSKDPTLAKHQTSSAIRAALADGQLTHERELSYRFEIHRRLAVGRPISCFCWSAFRQV